MWSEIWHDGLAIVLAAPLADLASYFYSCNDRNLSEMQNVLLCSWSHSRHMKAETLSSMGPIPSVGNAVLSLQRTAIFIFHKRISLSRTITRQPRARPLS
jgi:hypothetical protein